MVQNNLNWALSVAAALPATHDAAGFGALSFTDAEGLITPPTFGTTHSVSHVADLKKGQEIPFKGAAKGKESTATFFKVDSDAGQALLKTQADDSDGKVSIKLVKLSTPGGSPASGDEIRYAKGVLHSYEENEPNASNERGFTVSFSQEDVTVETTVA